MTTARNPIYPVLLVDDETNAIRSFDITLRSQGYNNIIRCQDSREAMSVISRETIDLILLDIIMPHVSGEEILEEVARNYPDIPVIMVTGNNEVETAVRCMRNGAFDYVLKPVDSERLLTSVKRALEIRMLRRENAMLVEQFKKNAPERPEVFEKIITRDPKMIKLFQYMEAVAVGTNPIMITGETGVGKELFAKAIHDLSGRPGEFVAVNVAGLDDNVFSDTLFGHSKGAFTGADTARKGLVETADSGTLFLDEIGDLAEESQVKLLRLLEQNEYFPLGADLAKPANARFVVATHKSLEMLKEGGKFRQDLYYRLCVHHVHIPPLRKRRGDIPLLLEHFLDLAAKDFSKKKPTYPKELISLLHSYHFPGNIREFRAMVNDAVGMHKSRMLSMESFKNKMQYVKDETFFPGKQNQLKNNDHWARELNELPTLKEAAEILVHEALRRAGNNQKNAAMMLGISPQALNQRLKRSS